MRTIKGHGDSETYLFEPGDLVRLTRSETGPLASARPGDWGVVMRVHACGALDLKLSGYSRPKDASMSRAMAIPCGHVEPCDRQGVPLRRGFSAVWDTRPPR
jgi:hypothetical protein